MRSHANRHAISVVLAVCLAALLAVALVGCGSGSGTSSTGTSAGSGAAAGGTTITEEGFAFNPANATVKVGDTVTFTNKDSAPHNVKIDGQELGSQNQGESKSWTASKAGKFPYSCVIHPSMTGEITVE